MESHITSTLDGMYDRAKQALMLETDRPHVLREMNGAAKLSGESKRPLPPIKDYSDRGGFPNGRPQAATAVLAEAVVVSVRSRSSVQVARGLCNMRELREASAWRIALSLVCLCSAISIVAFNSGAVYGFNK